MTNTHFKPQSIFRANLNALTAAICLAGLVAPALAQTTSQDVLMQKLEQMQQELSRLKGELAEIKAAQTKTQSTAEQANVVAQQAKTDVAAVAGTGLKVSGPSTVVTGYGEINYNRPTKNANATQADLRRAVIGLQHRFDDKTKFVGEFEWEHAVTSATDRGEAAVEQAYIEHQLNDRLAVRAGLFLIPMGLINENHEPTAFYGVERNCVETAIIPSTWREGGVQLVATTDAGLTLQGGISTSFDLGKWDATSGEGRESPLGAVHQEMAQAKARNLALFGAINWRGVPGLLLGASLFGGRATQAGAAASSRLTLWDLHGRWTPGRWDIAGVYARGAFSNTSALNLPLVGNPTLIPRSFDGWYLQTAYRLWSRGDYALSPFVRWEEFNTARAYADLGPGLTPGAARTERVVTAGANLQVAQGIVVKADLQRFRENADLNRVNLGLGWSF